MQRIFEKHSYSFCYMDHFKLIYKVKGCEKRESATKIIKMNRVPLLKITQWSVERYMEFAMSTSVVSSDLREKKFLHK